MKDVYLSRRAVLGSAVTAALIPSLASESLAAQSRGPVLNGQPVSTVGKPRFLHTATTMMDGTILMVGGYHTDERSRQGTDAMPSTSVEVYDPSSGNWQTAAPLKNPRARHAAVLLADGRVAVSGGVNQIALDSVEIYDPRNDSWSHGEPLPKPMYDHAMSYAGSHVVLSGGAAGTPALAHVIADKAERSVP